MRRPALPVALVQGLVAVAVVVGFGGLGYGPVRHYLDDAPPPSITEVTLADPTAAPRLPRWPVGVVDTVDALPGSPGAAQLTEPTALPITYAEAARLSRRPGTVTITGGPRGASVLGVGAVVTADDVATLAALPEPARTDLVGFIARADGLALSVTAVGAVPGPGLTVVDGDSSADLRQQLADADQSVSDLLGVWAQVRPELTALIDPGAAALDPATALGASGLAASSLDSADPWDVVVAGVVRDEILPALDAGLVPLAPALLASRSPYGLVDLDGATPRLSARGAAYAVAARALQPGSRAMPVRARGDLDVRAYARPGGGASLLMWNPGVARTVTVLAPQGERVLRFRVPVAAQSLVGVVLAAR